MALQLYEVEDLTAFTGRDEEYYENEEFLASAMQQAVDLFQLGTELTDTPTDAFETRLYMYAVLEMADVLYATSKFRDVRMSPFSSETIGSYSYTKAAKALANGDALGLFWFDRAIAYFSAADSDITSSSKRIFESADLLAIDPSDDTEATTYVLGPAEIIRTSTGEVFPRKPNV